MPDLQLPTSKQPPTPNSQNVQNFQPGKSQAALHVLGVLGVLGVLEVGRWELLGNWKLEVGSCQRHLAAPSTIALFFDPKPRQLQSVAAGAALRPVFGMKSRSHAGSGVR